jgi:hypothetical protein
MNVKKEIPQEEITMRAFKVAVCIVVLAAALSLGAIDSQATIIDQWASSVIGFSSQWSTGSWSAAQALGAPNTGGYGDISTSWAPLPLNGSLEYITLGYATPVYASSVVIRETYGNGFVYQVDVLDQSNALHPVWTGTDPSLPGTPVDFMVTFAPTPYLVKGVKIYTDTNHNLSAWEEIDAVKLTGNNVPLPGAVWLLGTGLAGLAAFRRRFMR